MTKAVIFDHDGILVDSEPLHKIAWKRTFAPMGINVTEDELNANIGKSDQIFTEYIIQTHSLDAHFSDILLLKRRHMRELMENESALFPGVPELVETLASLAMRLGIASSAKRDEIQITFDRFGYEKYFSAVVSADDVQHHKPHPEPYELCCEQLGVAPVDAVAIEDSPAGIESARQAGLYVIAAATSFAPARLAQAHAVITNFKDTAGIVSLIINRPLPH